MTPVLNFFGDTARIVYLLAMFAISLALNTALFVLNTAIMTTVRAVEMYTILFLAYGAKIKAVLDKPLTPSNDTKGTVH